MIQRESLRKKPSSLGGEDFDKRLIDYLSDEFKKDQGIDLRGDPLAMQSLKTALSAFSPSQQRVSPNYQGVSQE